MNLTAKNNSTDLAIEMMFGKAMCAYANFMQAYNAKNPADIGAFTKEQVEKAKTAYESEYEATVRCLAMLTVEHLPQVCKAVIEQAKEEFGI